MGFAPRDYVVAMGHRYILDFPYIFFHKKCGNVL